LGDEYQGCDLILQAAYKDRILKNAFAQKAFGIKMEVSP